MLRFHPASSWLNRILYLVVEPTHLKNMSQNGNFPNFWGENKKCHLKPPPIDMFIPWPFTMTIIQDLPENKAHLHKDNWWKWHLTRYTWVDFCSTNLKHMSPIGSFPPSLGEHKKYSIYLKPPPSYSIPITITTFCSRIQSSCSLIVRDVFRSLRLIRRNFDGKPFSPSLRWKNEWRWVDFWTLAFTSWDL